MKQRAQAHFLEAVLDRKIVYPSAIPQATDILSAYQDPMINDGYIAQMLAGTSPLAVGLALSATAPASMTVNVGPGAITQLTEVDPNAYGDLGTDTNPLVKVGINQAATPFTLTAPTTSGQSINYLIEATFEEVDGTPIVLPYVNPSNPAVPFSGPNNDGATQNSVRAQIASLQLLAGTPANTGTQTTPATTSGWSPLYVITVNFGQTQITSSSWSVAPGSPFIGGGAVNFGRLLGAPKTFTSSGTYTPSPGARLVRVRAVAGGGAGGGSAASPAGDCTACSGGGAGSYVEALFLVSSLTSSVAVTIGAGATGGAGSGNTGGQTTFGSYLTCFGGIGGGSQAYTNSVTNYAAQGTGGAAPTFSGALYAVGHNGQSGACGIVFSGNCMPGQGGVSPLGAGGPNIASGAGISASGFGAGGGGAGVPSSTGPYNGGNGAAGYLEVWEYS
jgi:hypothetical protein